MTREQIDAIEQLYIEHSDRLDARSYSIRELLAAARRALEMQEALEFAADVSTTLVKESSGFYSCWRTDAWGEVHHHAGSTPIEAIQNARRGM